MNHLRLEKTNLNWDICKEHAQVYGEPAQKLLKLT